MTSVPRPELPRCPACGVSWSDENDHLDGELLCHSCDELELHTCSACTISGSDQLEAALHYAARGWHVLPTRLEDKAPRTDLVRRGHLDATTDTDQLMEWWGPNGTALDSGVGIACEPSGLVVIDVDVPHHELPAELQHELARVPYFVRSPRGAHYYVRSTPGAKYRGQAAPGVDVKHRGYVCAPPTPGYVLDAPRLPELASPELHRQIEKVGRW